MGILLAIGHGGVALLGSFYVLSSPSGWVLFPLDMRRRNLTREVLGRKMEFLASSTLFTSGGDLLLAFPPLGGHFVVAGTVYRQLPS